jgi:uncharacterized membrane protein YqhA
MVMAAVVSSLLLSLLLFVITAIDVAELLTHATDYFVADVDARKTLRIEMVAHTVGAIDGFFVGHNFTYILSRLV